MIGIHLLGAADLGVKPQDYPDKLRHLESLSSDQQARLLADAHRSEPHHIALAPLGAFLHYAEPKISRIWLVATKQEPPDRGDTNHLAQIIASSLADEPTLFGAETTAEVIEVRGFGLNTMCNAVRERIESGIEPEAGVVVAIGSGSTENHLGILLGCIAAGVVPRLCATNRQDVKAQTHTFELLLERDMRRWLVRTSAFAALAVLDPQRKNHWHLLQAIKHLNWEDAKSIWGSLPTGAGSDLKPPNTACRPGLPQPADWEFYRSVMESLLLRQIGIGEPTGLFLARPWLEMESRRLLEQLRRDDPKAALKVEQDVVRAREAFLSAGDIEFGPFVQQQLKKAERKASVAFKGLPDSQLGTFLRRGRWQSLLRLGRDADHGKFPSNPRTAREAVRFLDERSRQDPIAEELARFGHQPWPPIPHNGRVIVQCVGQRDLDPSGTMPMLIAVEEGLERMSVPLTISHLRLVASHETYDAATQIAEVAQSAFDSVAVIGPVRPADYGGIRNALLAALRGMPQLEAAGGVIVAANPGGKAMNLGALAAALQWGFDARRPVSVFPLRRSKDGGTQLLVEEPAARHGRRLAHDKAVGLVLSLALDDLDFGLAEDILRAGSSHWDGLAKVVEMLKHLAYGSRPPLFLPMGSDAEPSRLHKLARHGRWPKGDEDARRLGWLVPNERELWPARVKLYSTIIDQNPWRAIYNVSAVAERCWSEAWRRVPRCYKIWRWRNDSPFGHKVWKCPPVRSEIHEAFNKVEPALHEALNNAEPALVGAGLVPRTHVDPQALVSLRDAMREYVRELALGN